jgi:hypothetical protein
VRGRHASRYEAITKKHRHPIIGLMEDEENKRAIRFYEKAGFAHLSKPRKSQGVIYLCMALDIAEFVVQEAAHSPQSVTVPAGASRASSNCWCRALVFLA